MLIAVFMMGGLGLIIGLFLAFASKVFYVYVDPKIEAIDDILPGANCGGCGLPGCSANAKSIVNGQTGPDSCVAADDDVASAIAAVIGVSVDFKESNFAFLGCNYGVNNSDVKFKYNGLSDCRAAAILYGGMKVCNIGCLGLGTCSLKCPFNAIIMSSEGIPIVDKSKCTGCGTCSVVCPKKIITITSLTKQIVEEYSNNDCLSPCQRTCPAEIDIPKYIQLIKNKDYIGSIKVIKERNPFPSVIGRICPRPCENMCRREYVDEAVSINLLKRFSADYERKIGKHILPLKAPNSGYKIAIVGGGVHGLSNAFFSARLGYEPTVFEMTNKLGGLLNTAIASYRLPKEVLDWDIDGIIKMGVKIELNKNIGKDLSINSLFKNKFRAISIASGGWDSKLSNTNNDIDFFEPIPGVFLLINFLNIKSNNDLNFETFLGDNILFVGGDSLADSIIRKCIDFGIKHINLLLENNSKIQTSLDYKENISIRKIYGKNVSKLIGMGNNLTHVEITDYESQDIEQLCVENIVFSSGRLPEIVLYKPDNNHLNNDEDLDNNSWVGCLVGNQQHISIDNSDNIVHIKNEKSDFSSAIKAVAHGRKSAIVMYNLFNNDCLSYLNNNIKIQDTKNITEITKIPRNVMPISDNQIITEDYELEKGFDDEMAHLESLRCLNCGLICYSDSYKNQILN